MRVGWPKRICSTGPNRRIEPVRWLVRFVKDRNLISVRQFAFIAKGLEECGRMVGGWLKQSRAKGATSGNEAA